jgi:predicted transcriptional regulator
MPLIYRNKIMMSDVPYLYPDRIYIVKDIILKLIKQGDLNQTSLLSFCELNLKHMSILEDMEANLVVNRDMIGSRGFVNGSTR